MRRAVTRMGSEVNRFPRDFRRGLNVPLRCIREALTSPGLMEPFPVELERQGSLVELQCFSKAFNTAPRRQ